MTDTGIANKLSKKPIEAFIHSPGVGYRRAWPVLRELFDTYRPHLRLQRIVWPGMYAKRRA